MTQSINKELFEAYLREGAFFRKPSGKTYLWIGPWNKDSINSKKSNSSLTGPQGAISVQEFFSSHAAQYFSREKTIQIQAVDLQKLLNEYYPDSKPTLMARDFVLPKKELFEESFRQIQGKIQRQEIEKAVPCSFMRSENKPTIDDRVSWMKKLLAAPESLYSFGFWNLETGIMGATPEILFERDGHVIQSMALAGTMLRSTEANPQKLLKSSKDLHEHQVVVDDLEKQFAKVGWVKKGDMKVVELPTLFHLMTPFEAEVGNKTDAELIKLLHPTPALGVHPRAFGFHWLEQLPEQSERRWFGAPILFQYSEKQSTCLVAIRNIQWGMQGSKIGAGCGLVKESNLESEWTEIQNKLDSVLNLLGMK